MPTILLTAWKLWQPVAAILAPVLAIALVTLWIVDTGRLHAAASDNNALRAQIDDPNTGFRAQLSRSQANAAQLRANGDALQKALDAQNASIADMQAAADAANARALTALRAQAASLVDAMNLARQLEARKPQNGSYADLAGLLKGAAP